METALLAADADAGELAEGVQHQLPVTVVDALGVARGAGGVKRRGAGVLVEVTELVGAVAGRQQRLVARGELDAGGRRRVGLADEHESFHRAHLGPDRLEQRQEVLVHEDQVVVRMIDRVENLLRRQAHVDAVKHGAHHRYREEALEVAVTVPVEHRYRISGAHPERFETGRQLPDAPAQCEVVVAHAIAIDDLAPGCIGQGRVQQLLDEQRVGVGGRRAVAGVVGHGRPPRRRRSPHPRDLPAPCAAEIIAAAATVILKQRRAS